MDSKNVIEGAVVQAVMASVDIKKKAKIAHEEHSSSPPSISKVEILALLLSSVFPYFINPDQLNWGGKVMFLFVGAEIFILLGLFFAQPETKNRTYADIDALYTAKVPARKFSEYIVEDGVVVRKDSKE